MVRVKLIAVKYDCRCGKKCLGRAGSQMQVYEFRRGLRAKALTLGQGGLRDAIRDTFEPHFDLHVLLSLHGQILLCEV